MLARIILLLQLSYALALSVMSYNIMDSGFADQSGKYDPVGDRVPGNLTNFVASFSSFVDVLGVVETGAWSAKGSAKHPGYNDIAASWGFAHVHVRGELVEAKATSGVANSELVTNARCEALRWVAQWNEMVEDPSQRIGRPRQLYIGSPKRDYIDIAKR